MKSIFVLIFVLFSVQVWAAKGIIVHQITKNEPSYGGQPYSTKTYIANEKFRTEEGQDGQSIIIGRLDKNLFWIFEAGSKTYTEIDSKFMEQISPQGLSDTIKKSGSYGELFRRTGKEKRIGNWDCFEVVMVPEKRFGLFQLADQQTIWVTKKKYPYGKTYLKKLFQLLNPDSKGFEEMNQIFGDGFPIEVSITSMNSTSTTTVTKIEEDQTIDDGLFEPIPGYKKMNGDSMFKIKE